MSYLPLSIQRKIIHIDCDCFYAAVEVRDNPKLKGLPIAVGGEARSRGVLSTCSYEARQFGLHSAMATSQALKRCPQLILLPHRISAYKEASSKIQSIFYRYTSMLEPLSLDEAFLDVSENSQYNGSATLLSEEIRRTVEHEVGITVSAGIAPNKFLAKVASDWNKPNGQFVISPNAVNDFMLKLAVEKIPGVGKKSMVKMQRLGIQHCADLQKIDEGLLKENFGVFGLRLKELSFGRDDRPVSNRRQRKSLSIEHTFMTDIASFSVCSQQLPALFNALLLRLEPFQKNTVVNQHPAHIKSLLIKLKFFDFTATTIECQANACKLDLYQQLLKNAWLRTGKPIRLLGLGVGFSYQEPEQQQLRLF